MANLDPVSFVAETSPLVTRLSDKPVVEARAAPGYDPTFNAGLLVHDGTYHLFARGVREGYRPRPPTTVRGFLDRLPRTCWCSSRRTASTTRSAMRWRRLRRPTLQLVRGPARPAGPRAAVQIRSSHDMLLNLRPNHGR